MTVNSWISNNTVFVCVSGDGFSMLKGIAKDKFVENYDEYVRFYPKVSRSKNNKDMLITRKAIERCWMCKKTKPITEFNAYAVFEAPCFDCDNNKRKKKFSLPLSVWYSDFDITNVGKEIGGETQMNADMLPKVILTDKESGKVSKFTTYWEAGKFLGISEGSSSKVRIMKKASDKYEVYFTETKESEQIADLKKTFVKKRIVKTANGEHKIVLVKPCEDSETDEEALLTEEIPPPMIDDSSDEECDKYNGKAISDESNDEEKLRNKHDEALKDLTIQKITKRGW